MSKFHDNFDFENAKLDIHDAGGDPDELSHYDPEKRDRYMKKMGLNPKNYGSKWGDFTNLDKTKGTSSGSSGCYLTSACIKAAGLPDDCEELTTLRWFRDNYLKSIPDGEEDIQEYYRIAPAIVMAVNSRSDSDIIWTQIYQDLILKCVELIKNNDYKRTHQLYKNYTLKLKAITEMHDIVV